GSGHEAAIADAQKRADTLATERESARAEAVRLEIAAGQITEQRMSLARECEANRRALSEHERSRETKRAHRELAGARFAEADNLKADLELKLIEARAHLEDWSEFDAMCKGSV